MLAEAVVICFGVVVFTSIEWSRILFDTGSL